MEPKVEGIFVKTILPLSFLVCVLFVMGCATDAPDVTAYYDPISGRRTDLMENQLPAPDQPRELLWLNASRVQKSLNAFRYYLEVRYMATEQAGLLDISPGESLILLVDETTMKFNGSGSLNMRKDPKKGIVRESAIYEVTRDQLQKIADGKNVIVQVKGANGLVERQFKPENFQRLQRFMSASVGS